jgi:hypothetical protein
LFSATIFKETKESINDWHELPQKTPEPQPFSGIHIHDLGIKTEPI